MGNVIMIHGYNGIPKMYEWLEEKLVRNGYSVIMPKFPTQEGVTYKLWRAVLDNYKNSIEEKTIVIAHSIGNEFIIRYLVENNINIKMYVSLAGFANIFVNEGKEDLNRAVKEFLITEKEVERFNQLVYKKYCIYSDNDHIVPFDALERYSKVIGGESILIKGIGHMGKKSGLESIPEVLNIIEKNNM